MDGRKRRLKSRDFGESAAEVSAGECRRLVGRQGQHPEDDADPAPVESARHGRAECLRTGS